MAIPSTFLESRYARSIRFERAIHDVAQIAREILRCSDPAQSSFSACAAARLKRAPRAERGGQPRGHLRVLRIEFEHGVGEEGEARAVSTIELSLIVLRKAANPNRVRTPDAR